MAYVDSSGPERRLPRESELETLIIVDTLDLTLWSPSERLAKGAFGPFHWARPGVLVWTLDWMAGQVGPAVAHIAWLRQASGIGERSSLAFAIHR